jgi:prevent-host-death family protein
MNITEARKRLLDLPDTLGEEPLYITRHGKPVLVVLRQEDYEAAVETAEVIADPDTVAAIRQSEAEIAAKKTVSVEAARKRLLG